ncbi:piggyBac transposable element-derived protein 3-like [Metopolophium dirhodum]|uniref:piggyBac transposable element-derived protein 3-like n=1 Tax=Metopolophium dirhodum TaxID=44670 RepID=UPI00299050A8|nr:piggyBac transposable element-derived protein 3-like [Metopolophium dirhodum]
MYRNKKIISSRSLRLLKSVLPPLDSEDSETEDETELSLKKKLNTPTVTVLDYSDSSTHSSSPPSGASELENYLYDIDDFPMFDELGTDINNYINLPTTSYNDTLAEVSISTSNSILDLPNVERNNMIDNPINLSIVENILDLSSPNNFQSVDLHSDSDLLIVQRKSGRLAQMSYVEPMSVSSVYVESVEPPPLSTLRNKTKKMIRKKMTFKWTKQFKFPVDLPPFRYSSIPQNISTPYQYFKMFLTDDILELISKHTNIYSSQKLDKSLETTVEEIKHYIGIEVLMGIVAMPAYTDYWSADLRYNQIADTMPLKRYQMLRRYIHFVDNETVDTSDRFYKVRPILEGIRKNCLSIEQSKQFSIDEMMITYKGTKAGSRRQYIKIKPKTVYFDNWFTSLELVTYLRKKFGILSLGTIQQNRLRGCDIINDKDLLKKGRGSFEMRCDNKKKISVVKWADNKCVTLVSSFVPVNEQPSSVRRYDKNMKAKIPINCPTIIKEYNSKMGGVDLADMLVSLYRTGLKSHRWYLAVFSQLLDISVNNAWLLYRREFEELNNDLNVKYMPLKQFRTAIAKTLINQRKPGRPIKELLTNPRIQKLPRSRPTDDVRLDNEDHLPKKIKKGRCMLCPKGQTVYSCTKCNVRLCTLDERNCFYTYHKQK